MSRVVLRDGYVAETNDEIMRLPHDDDLANIMQSGSIWEAFCKEFNLLLGGRPAVNSGGDLEAQWKREDRKAWADYRIWEDKNIPIDHTRPLKDLSGLVEARRAFEKHQKREREQFFKKARDGGRE